MSTVSQTLGRLLASHASHAFGLMGNGNAHLIDALVAVGLPFTAVRHEAATVASADAFTRITGKLAVATTTYGAGFTNMLTALAEAAQARTPLLVVVGDAPRSGMRPWDIDQELAASAVGVPTYELGTTQLTEQVERAVTETLQQRRPVVLALPYDLPLVNTTSVDSDAAETTRHSANAPLDEGKLDKGNIKTNVGDINKAVQLLATAERPVVIAGRGAWIAGASHELDAIADRLGALTASTALARGIFSQSEYHLGITGGFGQPEAMHTIAKADVVLVVGASLNQFTMRFGELLGEGTRLVRIDRSEVAVPPTSSAVQQLLLQGDARDVLQLLLEGLAAEPSPAVPWRTQVPGLETDGALRVRESGSPHPEGLCDDGLLDPRAVAAKLAQLLPDDRHVTSDGGHFIGWANMYWPVASPERMIMVGTAYQTIGLGFATVAGVAAAAPESTVVLTTGDGGGLMALADLETTIRTAKSCVVVVWNDSAYSAEVHLYGLMGVDQGPMMIPTVNFAGLATALGAAGVVVETLHDLEALATWRDAGARGTIVLDCRISRSVVAPYQHEIQRVNGLDV